MGREGTPRNPHPPKKTINLTINNEKRGMKKKTLLKTTMMTTTTNRMNSNSPPKIKPTSDRKNCTFMTAHL